ncbi:MAG: hypothetical protein A3C30_02585 [Candidatus Levybacteria bacterium RIFCSPHIGHO2_02_FULL_40_18]|nr:MAG: hypothetical protein A2869_05390 [Candidatus Levybacteria bacterium RIFCSPHIGHO2_01_FULL_40_58]OGH26862.1 MAG: hypothetical protein A3C30_02585 [Candidatus Levybacteria bacterium RIFCSPHIGHO2_02_FULL_40_18]OGH31984.1 MAG: hypothetical protein A3E43_03565 [Candidatus Levybacteria bacterium RIFCSPHIGHO2_12_FULL_40_31]OGH40894.1 MAG: hypothetical protein A2894_04835 [Candidatus Levybacteria bacterium RIFCSPLOWO2_01_FULL_40_64]OGH49535.1 MAG: hypothetical protein A3I54_00110 [Candidatus Lev
MLNKTNILGVGFTEEKESKILEYIFSELRKDKKRRDKIVIFTPNPEQVAAAVRNEDLRNLLNQAQISLPDGVGILWAAKLFGKPIYARITGVDFMKSLVKSISNQPVITGYFGGQKGVAEACALCLQKKWPNLRVGYASDFYDKEKMIQSDIDILFVALGFPKQEKWIFEHKDEIPATVIMAVGGAFDFFSGRIMRAPGFVRRIGFEWLFRLILQPWRFWRQLQIWHFSGLIFREALTNRLKRLKT